MKINKTLTGLMILVIILAFILPTKEKHDDILIPEMCYEEEGYRIVEGQVHYFNYCEYDDGCGPLAIFGCEDPYCSCGAPVVVHEADIETFKPLFSNDNLTSHIEIDRSYAKDKNTLYRNGKIVDSRYIDLETFEVINYVYTKDKNNVYRHLKIVKDANPNNFQLIPSIEGGAKDEDTFYHYGIIVQGANERNFTDLGGGYGAYKNYVYSKRNIIVNADSGTFELFSVDGYAKDKNRVYKNGRLQLGEDPNTFIPKNKK